MTLSIADISACSVEELRSGVPAWLRDHVAPGQGENAQRYRQAADQVEARTRAAMEEGSDQALLQTSRAYSEAGADYGYYPADPMARQVGRVFMDSVVEESQVTGLEGLRKARARGPCVVVCNHLSYVDTQTTDVLLQRHGAIDIADALLAVAGPKVYTHSFRRMAAIGLNILKTAQSSRLDHNAAALSLREVRRVAMETIRDAYDLIYKGHTVVLYAEGGRSRTGRLGPFLKAVSRYLKIPALSVVPMAVIGTRELFPIHQDRLWPGPARLCIGEPISADGKPRNAVLEESWQRLAALLPPEAQPEPGTPALV